MKAPEILTDSILRSIPILPSALASSHYDYDL